MLQLENILSRRPRILSRRAQSASEWYSERALAILTFLSGIVALLYCRQSVSVILILGEYLMSALGF